MGVGDNLEILKCKYFQISKSEKRLHIIKHELELLYNELTAQRAKMNKEHQDVIKLEKLSKQLLFKTILGNKELQLEIERQEYLQAVLEYNATAYNIDLIKYEQEILIK